MPVKNSPRSSSEKTKSGFGALCKDSARAILGRNRTSSEDASRTGQTQSQAPVKLKPAIADHIRKVETWRRKCEDPHQLFLAHHIPHTELTPPPPELPKPQTSSKIEGPARPPKQPHLRGEKLHSRREDHSQDNGYQSNAENKNHSLGKRQSSKRRSRKHSSKDDPDRLRSSTRSKPVNHGDNRKQYLGVNQSENITDLFIENGPRLRPGRPKLPTPTSSPLVSRHCKNINNLPVLTLSSPPQSLTPPPPPSNLELEANSYDELYDKPLPPPPSFQTLEKISSHRSSKIKKIDKDMKKERPLFVRSQSPAMWRDDDESSLTLTAEEAENIRLIRGAQSPPSWKPPAVPPPLPPKPSHQRLSIASSTETIQNPRLPTEESFKVSQEFPEPELTQVSVSETLTFPQQLSTENVQLSKLSNFGELSEESEKCKQNEAYEDNEGSATCDRFSVNNPLYVMGRKVRRTGDFGVGSMIDGDCSGVSPVCERACGGHARSDSGVSSMSERTSTMSPISLSSSLSIGRSRESLRSSSIVSSFSTLLEEERLEETEQSEQSPNMSFEINECDIRKKLKNLRMAKIAVLEDTGRNEQVGDQLYLRLRQCLDSQDFEKITNYSEEVEKITNLLLSLSSRLIKCDISLDGQERDQKINTVASQSKRSRLEIQLEEARHLKENIENRAMIIKMILRRQVGREDQESFINHIRTKEDLIRQLRATDFEIEFMEENLQILCLHPKRSAKVTVL